MKSRVFFLGAFIFTLTCSSAFALNNDPTTNNAAATKVSPEDAATNNYPQNAAPNSQSAPDANAQNTAAGSSSHDSEMLAWLIAVDKSEVAAAKEALKRNNVDSAIKKYAHMMIHDHSQNLHGVIRLSKKIDVKPVDTAAVTTFKQKNESALAELKPLDTKTFQTTYINAMVNGHSEALQKIDEALKSVDNPKLKKFLESTRKTVAKHLEAAKKIQDKLQSSSNNAMPAKT